MVWFYLVFSVEEDRGVKRMDRLRQKARHWGGEGGNRCCWGGGARWSLSCLRCLCYMLYVVYEPSRLEVVSGLDEERGKR